MKISIRKFESKDIPKKVEWINNSENVFDIPLVIMGVQVILGSIIYMLLAVLYMIKIKKNPTLVNEVLKLLHIKKKFEMK